MKLASVLVVLMVMAASGSARAEGPQKVSVTWSPIHLVLPVVELEGEFSPAPHMGVGLIAGVGRVTDEVNNITATAYEGGGQFNYYFMRRFSGVHAGLEVVYLHLGDIEQDASLTGAGLSVGPYAGYKVMTDFGFTFVAQLGAAMVHVSAQNTSSMKSENKFGPLLNLNIGWSF